MEDKKLSLYDISYGAEIDGLQYGLETISWEEIENPILAEKWKIAQKAICDINDIIIGGVENLIKNRKFE